LELPDRPLELQIPGVVERADDVEAGLLEHRRHGAGVACWIGQHRSILVGRYTNDQGDAFVGPRAYSGGQQHQPTKQYASGGPGHAHAPGATPTITPFVGRRPRGITYNNFATFAPNSP